MKFKKTSIAGAFTIDLEPLSDQRGFFARSWDAEQFKKRGLDGKISQCSVSFNKKKGTLRGLHYQAAPYGEAKVVRCTEGAIFDVIVDLRPKSATFKKHVAVELSAKNRRMLYIPKGCAHGFLTLTDNAEVYYQISGIYKPETARGVRWNDPAFGVRWPGKPTVISQRDARYADYGGR